MSLKKQVLGLLTSPPVVACTRRLLDSRAAIFMLHRFAVPELGVEGHSEHAVRQLLAHLRKHEFELLPLTETMARLSGDGPPPRGAVSFTIDDGYFDHASVGARVFAEFDCPVTTFVTSGFLDGTMWFWWDRIEYVFSQTQLPAITTQLDGSMLNYPLLTRGWRRVAQEDFIGRCKEIADASKHAAIEALARAAEVDLPARAPERYAPMSWSELRTCETRGMTFGPHTVTHPILSRTPLTQLEEELTISWSRLQQESRSAVPVFCYPNGRASVDFGEREITILQRLGMLGAVTGEVGYAKPFVPEDQQAPFLVSRFPFNEDLSHSVQYAGGLELVKASVRKVLS
jgi:peptidoglycan/xylan/chitin deacetylase (PgdA/CDA1 family)